MSPPYYWHETDGPLLANLPRLWSQVEATGAVIIRSLGDLDVDPEDSLLRLASALGEPSTSDVITAASRWIHRVEELDEPVIDSVGMPVLSTTNRRFSCHTDEFFSEHPADLVLLACVEPARCGGGQTLLAALDGIVRQLDAATVSALGKPIFPSRCGSRTILSGRSDRRQIRFNGDEIRQHAPSTLALESVLELEVAIERCVTEVSLQAGDVLVIDNHRAVHGRTAYQPGSGRLLLRARANRTRHRLG